MGMKARPKKPKCTWGNRTNTPRTYYYAAVKCRRNAAPPPKGVKGDPQLCKRHQALYGVSLLAGWE